MKEKDQNFAAIAEKVLLIPELLERILLHLSLRDVLYNAQRVNHFWRDCIGVVNRAGGSPSLRQKCFIDAKCMNEEQEKRDSLFLTLDSPEPIVLSLDRLAHPFYRRFCEKTENAAFTFSEIRKLLSDHPADKRALHNYIWQMHTFWRAGRSDIRYARSIQKFEEYCPNKEWSMCQHQLNNKKRHPILDCFDNISSFWTGYQSHLIFAIGDKYIHSYGQIKQVLEAIKFLLGTEPAGATWKYGMVTQPICTRVTVFVRIPTSAHSEHQGFLNIDGVTIKEFFQIIIRVCKVALYAVNEEYLATIVSSKQVVAQRQAVMAMADLEELLENLGLDTWTQCSS
jgi:hypothetical protein